MNRADPHPQPLSHPMGEGGSDLWRFRGPKHEFVGRILSPTFVKSTSVGRPALSSSEPDWPSGGEGEYAALGATVTHVGS
jgi:hypothetical protein